MITARLRKRHNQQISFYGKRVAKFILFALFVTTLYFISNKFNTYFPIKSVKVFGIQHVDQTVVEQGLTPLVKKGFFAIDVETIKDRLLQSPWVAKATVQRIWPDQIRITVIEKTPIARWNDMGLVSNEGEIFNPAAESYPGDLPQFIGQDSQHVQILQYYKKLSGLFMPLHFKITRLELTPDSAWNLTFNNGMKLTVGHKDVLTRLSHFVKVYPKIIGNKVAKVDYVDLRYSNGLAVRWKTVI